MLEGIMGAVMGAILISVTLVIWAVACACTDSELRVRVYTAIMLVVSFAIGFALF